jgi:hypothetical protein
MVALLTEKRYALSALAKRENVHISTVWRWVHRGSRGVKLGTMQVGGRTYTTDSLFAEFVRATTAAARGDAIESPPLAPNAQHEADNAELIATGA